MYITKVKREKARERDRQIHTHRTRETKHIQTHTQNTERTYTVHRSNFAAQQLVLRLKAGGDISGIDSFIAGHLSPIRECPRHFYLSIR